MRSRSDYIVTKEEVHGYANLWLSTALRLEYEGTKCAASTLLQVLLIAAARVVSIFAACRDLADAPSDQTIRNALFASLPEMAELERRLNRALSTELPKALRRKRRIIAIDLTLIPYHGQPLRHADHAKAVSPAASFARGLASECGPDEACPRALRGPFAPRRSSIARPRRETL